MENPDNHNPVFIITKINTPLPIRKSPKAGAYPVPGCSDNFKLRQLIHLPDEIGHKTLRGVRALLRNMGINCGQVILGGF